MKAEQQPSKGNLGSNISAHETALMLMQLQSTPSTERQPAPLPPPQLIRPPPASILTPSEKAFATFQQTWDTLSSSPLHSLMSYPPPPPPNFPAALMNGHPAMPFDIMHLSRGNEVPFVMPAKEGGIYNKNLNNCTNNHNAFAVAQQSANAFSPSFLEHLQFKRKKRQRTNQQQLDMLEAIFHSEKLPSPQIRMKLADELGMSVRRVQIWFQNRRAKWKRKLQKPKYQQQQQQQQQHQQQQQELKTATSPSSQSEIMLESNQQLVRPIELLRESTAPDAFPATTPPPMLPNAIQQSIEQINLCNQYLILQNQQFEKQRVGPSFTEAPMVGSWSAVVNPSLMSPQLARPSLPSPISHTTAPASLSLSSSLLSLGDISSLDLLKRSSMQHSFSPFSTEMTLNLPRISTKEDDSSMVVQLPPLRDITTRTPFIGQRESALENRMMLSPNPRQANLIPSPPLRSLSFSPLATV